MNAGRGTSVFQNALVWFGAAVSIAEIEAGGQLAAIATGARFRDVAAAVILGHLIGGVLLFIVGLIGARARQSAMDCVKTPFGRWGAGFFAIANIVQLLGWTAVMVAQGAQAASELLPRSTFAQLAVCIGLLVALWIFVGLGGASRVNSVAMVLLFALTVFLCVRLFGGGAGSGALWRGGEVAGKGVFWAALELSVAMPLSWLPLVADYTKDARGPVAASAASAATYTVVSTWMYGIGLGAALASGGESFAKCLAGVGVFNAGVLVVILSTVTTTYLDAYSAGESARSLWGRLPAKGVGVAVCALGTLVAIFIGMEYYIDFLYLIASVFAPMAAVQIADWLVSRGAMGRRPAISVCVNIAAWIVGVATYHVALAHNCPVGATIPAMAFSAALVVVGGRMCRSS